nr:hypothetical protein HK105_005779 [Polyrhizophydium stewartii]
MPSNQELPPALRDDGLEHDACCTTGSQEPLIPDNAPKRGRGRPKGAIQRKFISTASGPWHEDVDIRELLEQRQREHEEQRRQRRFDEIQFQKYHLEQQQQQNQQQQQQQQRPSQEQETPVKRGRGRPKGAPNKPHLQHVVDIADNRVFPTRRALATMVEIQPDLVIGGLLVGTEVEFLDAAYTYWRGRVAEARGNKRRITFQDSNSKRDEWLDWESRRIRLVRIAPVRRRLSDTDVDTDDEDIVGGGRTEANDIGSLSCSITASNAAQTSARDVSAVGHHARASKTPASRRPALFGLEDTGIEPPEAVCVVCMNEEAEEVRICALVLLSAYSWQSADMANQDNQLVACFECSKAYHQRCHTPRIHASVLQIADSPWICADKRCQERPGRNKQPSASSTIESHALVLNRISVRAEASVLPARSQEADDPNVYEYEPLRRVFVHDGNGRWWKGRMIEFNNHNRVLVRYDEWGFRFDEWVELGSTRIRLMPPDETVAGHDQASASESASSPSLHVQQGTAAQSRVSLSITAGESAEPSSLKNAELSGAAQRADLSIELAPAGKITVVEEQSHAGTQANPKPRARRPKTTSRTAPHKAALAPVPAQPVPTPASEPEVEVDLENETWKIFCNQCKQRILQYRYYCTYCETPSEGWEYESFDLCALCFQCNFPFHRHPRSSFAVQAIMEHLPSGRQRLPCELGGKFVTTFELDYFDLDYYGAGGPESMTLAEAAAMHALVAKPRESSRAPNKKRRKKIFWAHETCAKFTPEVYVSPDTGEWYNVLRALRRARNMRCFACKERGATIGCFHSKCYRSFHIMCTNKPDLYFEKGGIFWCPAHEAYINHLDDYDDVYSCDVCSVTLGQGANEGVPWFTCGPCSEDYFSSFDLCALCFDGAFPHGTHKHPREDFVQTTFAERHDEAVREREKFQSIAQQEQGYNGLFMCKDCFLLAPRSIRIDINSDALHEALGAPFEAARRSTTKTPFGTLRIEAAPERRMIEASTAFSHTRLETSSAVARMGSRFRFPFLTMTEMIAMARAGPEQPIGPASVEMIELAEMSSFNYDAYLTRHAARRPIEEAKMQIRPKLLTSYGPQDDQLFSLFYDTTYYDIPGRAPRWATHSGGDYHGTWLPQLVRWSLLRYTERGDRVLSNFLGRGTDSIESFLLERRSHPPYKDCVSYSSFIDGDLSRLPEMDDFQAEMRKVAIESHRRVTLGVGDNRRECLYQPVTFKTLRTYMESGFEIEELVPGCSIERKRVVLGTVWALKVRGPYSLPKLAMSKMIQRFGKDETVWEQVSFPEFRDAILATATYHDICAERDGPEPGAESEDESDDGSASEADGDCS